jgi:hypothetical protein
MIATPGSWFTFFAVVGVLCIVCPPLLGFVLGVGLFVLLWWLNYKALGG